MGTGKTLFLTILATLTQKPIYSNYSLSIPNKELRKFTINTINSEDFEEALVLIDEVYTLVDARTSMSAYNQLMSYILFQSRKKSLDICITAQLMSVIDIRYRNLIDYVVRCQKTDRGFLYTITNMEKTLTLRLSDEKAKEFYQFYNTNEIVKSERTKDLETRFLSDDEKQTIIDEWYRKLHKSKTKITKSYVKFKLIESHVKFDADILEKLYLKLKFNQKEVLA